MGSFFKPETDDVREAPSLVIIEELIKRGSGTLGLATAVALESGIEALGEQNITYVEDPYSATDNADALIVVTEWREFKQPDFRRLSNTLKAKLI